MNKLFFLFLFLAAFSAKAQKYSFQGYSTSEGLPQSQVNAICQDDEGYLWIGTLGGVAKFNGDKFKTYSSDDGLLNNRVSCISWFNKSIWIGHDGGVSIIEGRKIVNIPLKEELKNIAVSDIILFKGEVIVSLNGGGLFKVKAGKLVEIKGLKESELFIRDLHVLDNVMYLATRSGIVRTSNLKEFESMFPDLAYSISGIATMDNSILFSTFSQGIFTYSPKTGKIQERALRDPDIRVVDICVDKAKTIWLSTQFGLLKLESGEEELIDVDKGLPTSGISCVYQDRDLNIWIGTQGKGLIRAPRKDLSYFDKRTGLTSDLVISGFQSKSGNYFFGTLDIGVVKMTPKKEFEIIPFQFNNTVWAAQEDVNGFHWFGTKASLVSFDSKGNTIEYSIEDGLPGYKITCLLKLSATSMYVGGKEGVVLYKKGVFSEIATNRAEIGTARSMLTVDGILYVATDIGLFSLIGKKFVRVNDFSNTVFCLEKDSKNNLIFGTEDGLFYFRNGKIERIRFAAELGANYIYFLNYRKGTLYVGTNNGLYLLSGDDLMRSPKIVQIGLTDGLVDLETNLNSSFFDQKGIFWFGTPAGVVRFNPGKESSKEPLVKLKMNEILLNYESFDFSQYSRKIDSNNLPIDLVLPYNKNNLLFDFDGISLSGFANLNFQYWLEGLEEGWSPNSKNTSVSYSGLQPGDYVLHARILDIYGNSKDAVSFKFTIRSPFYYTWWFISLMVILLAGIIIAIFQFRIKRELEKTENERIAFKSRLVTLEQQSLNASMNRHFIFNALNSIQYFINTSDKLSANKYLTNFAKLIRKNLDSSSENNNMVTLAQEIERIELYLSLESMRFKDRFEFTIDTGNVELESYLIPAMIIQPFVENSIIHGVLPNDDVMGRIEIKISQTSHELLITVEDNGIGIEKSLSQKHDFEGDHKSQGMEITFKRIDLIRKVSKQSLELIGPNQINNDDGSVNGTRVLLKIRTENLEE